MSDHSQVILQNPALQLQRDMHDYAITLVGRDEDNRQAHLCHCSEPGQERMYGDGAGGEHVFRWLNLGPKDQR